MNKFFLVLSLFITCLVFAQSDYVYDIEFNRYYGTNPGATHSTVSSKSVKSISFSGNNTYVSGVFNSFNNNNTIKHVALNQYDNGTFNSVTGMSNFGLTHVNKVIKLSDGKTVVVGKFSFTDNGKTYKNMFVLSASNVLIPEFESAFDDEVNDVMELDNGWLIFGGHFRKYKTVARDNVAIVNSADASLQDQEYTVKPHFTGSGQSLVNVGSVKKIVKMSNGDILLVGCFYGPIYPGSVAGQQLKTGLCGMTMLYKDANNKYVHKSWGSTTFNNNFDGYGFQEGNAPGTINDVHLLADGRFLVVGKFKHFGNVNIQSSTLDTHNDNILVVSADGLTPSNFTALNYPSSANIFNTIIQDDANHVFVGGSFNNGATKMMQFNLNGTLVNDFTAANYAIDGEINSFSKKDNNIYIAGKFANFFGNNTNGIARLMKKLPRPTLPNPILNCYPNSPAWEVAAKFGIDNNPYSADLYSTATGGSALSSEMITPGVTYYLKYYSIDDNVHSERIPVVFQNHSESFIYERETVVTCANNYTWNVDNQVYTTSGTHNQQQTTLHPTHNCRVQKQLLLTLSTGALINEDVTACENYTWTQNGTTYNTSGVYQVTYADRNGCDSIRQLTLTINQPLARQMTVVACDAYTFYANNTVYTTGGTYTARIANQTGCDSLITLSLTINTSTSKTLNVEACGRYENTQLGINTNQSGVFNATIPNSVNCDSLITVNVTILPIDTNIVNVVNCGPYTHSGQTTVYTTSTIDYLTLTSIRTGCDSIVKLNVTINNPTTSTVVETACNSFTFTANNETYTTSGVRTIVIPNRAGCDSTITLNLTINQSPTRTIVETACETYTWSVNNQTYTSTGLYEATVANQSGCDSIIKLDLTINSPLTRTVTESACVTYTWPLNNQTYTTSGLYETRIVNQQGCDSLIKLDLTINSLPTRTENVTECVSYTWPLNGVTYTSSTQASYTINNVTGCDTVVTLNLTINGLPNVSVVKSDQELIVSETGATYQWINCENNTAIAGATNRSYTFTANGSYAVIVTKNGCSDTSACQVITGLSVENSELSTMVVYPNPTAGTVNVSFTRAYDFVQIEVIDLTGKVIDVITVQNQDKVELHLKGEAGMYQLKVTTENGSSVRKITLM